MTHDPRLRKFTPTADVTSSRASRWALLGGLAALFVALGYLGGASGAAVRSRPHRLSSLR